MFRCLAMISMDSKSKQKEAVPFFWISKAGKQILLCTSVAARGLDIPAVVCFSSFCNWPEPSYFIFILIFFWSSIVHEAFLHMMDFSHLKNNYCNFLIYFYHVSNYVKNLVFGQPATYCLEFLFSNIENLDFG